MARRRGWRRLGSRGRFRYVDARGRPIAGEEALERIELLRIPPAWRDVRISPRPYAKLQGLVPRRRRALRAEVPHVRDHDHPQEPRQSA